MVVFTRDDGAFAALAERIAADRGESLVGSLDEIRPGERVVYVEDPDAIDEETALSLQKRLLTHGPDEGGFSIVTGFTPENAADLYYESQSYGDNHCMMLGKLHDERFSYDENAEVLTAEDVSVEALAEQNEAGLESLALFEDGWSIHLYLNDGFVCGIPESRDLADFEGPHPTCATEGGGECPLEGEVIRAEEFEASHVFVNSCAPMLTNGVAGLPVHTGMNLLDGADSLVGSYRLVHSLHEEVVLHYALLRAGYDVVERCYLMNRNAHHLQVKSYPYICFGRPSATVDEPTSASFDADVTDTEIGVEVEVSEYAGHVLDFRVDESRVGDGERYFVRNLTDDLVDAPLYYTAFEEDGDVRVLVYTWGYVEIPELRLAVSPYPARAPTRQTIVDSVQNVGHLERLNLLDNKAQGQVSDFRNKLGGLSDHAYAELGDLNAHRELDDRVGQLTDAIDRVHDRLTTSLQNRNYSFLFTTYKSRTVPSGAYPTDRTCDHCGTRIFVREMTDVTGESTRALGTCPRCGYVFDVPVEGEGDLPVPEFEEGLMRADEETETMRVRFTNPRPAPMETTVYPWIKSERDDYHGIRLFDPDERTTLLAPGETETFEFELDLTKLDETQNRKENKYHVFAFVVGNMSIYSGSSRLFVGGAEEYPYYYE